MIPQPSPEWTDEERLELIAYLAQKQADFVRAGRWDSVAQFNVAERIRLIAIARETFLEANRVAMVGGE